MVLFERLLNLKHVFVMSLWKTAITPKREVLHVAASKFDLRLIYRPLG